MTSEILGSNGLRKCAKAIVRGDIRIPFQSKRHAERLLGEIQGAIERGNLAPGDVLAAYLPPNSAAKRVSRRLEVWIEKKRRQKKQYTCCRHYS